MYVLVTMAMVLYYSFLHVLDASKKHHEYLVRLEKQETELEKENRLKTCRLIQRRVRVC